MTTTILLPWLPSIACSNLGGQAEPKNLAWQILLPSAWRLLVMAGAGPCLRWPSFKNFRDLINAILVFYALDAKSQRLQHFLKLLRTGHMSYMSWKVPVDYPRLTPKHHDMLIEIVDTPMVPWCQGLYTSKLLWDKWCSPRRPYGARSQLTLQPYGSRFQRPSKKSTKLSGLSGVENCLE